MPLPLPLPFLLNSFSSFCLLLMKSAATDLKCFWPFDCKKLPSVKPKLNSANRCGLNHSLLSLKIY